MWHVNNGWRFQVIYQIYFWEDEFEFLQHITSTYWVYGKVEMLWLALSYVFWVQQNCAKLHKNENFDYYFVRCILALEIQGSPINYVWLNSSAIVLFFG